MTSVASTCSPSLAVAVAREHVTTASDTPLRPVPPPSCGVVTATAPPGGMLSGGSTSPQARQHHAPHSPLPLVSQAWKK
jgi:hypothetical protein